VTGLVDDGVVCVGAASLTQQIIVKKMAALRPFSLVKWF
jgi:hypothetical protein